MLEFTEKQKQLVRLMKEDKLKRLNILEGSVRSGKTWISLIMWAFWVASRPKDYLYMMAGKTLKTLERNCLLPLQGLVGENNFSYSLSKKEGILFGRKIVFEGNENKTSENKIRGMTLGGAYCDELSLFVKDFFVMLLSRLSTPGAKLLATTNPDVPTHWLLKEYLENVQLADDVFRMFFSIDDNTTLDEAYVSSLKKEYTGVYYDRFILGLWVVAAGAIYKIFSDAPRSYSADPDKLPGFDRINVGLDFGGNGSAHALVATALTHDHQLLFALKSVRIPAKDMTPQTLYREVKEFCTDVQKKYGRINNIYADSAEQTLIAGLRKAIKPMGIVVKNALKRKINDRIRATSMMMAGERFRMIEQDCESLINAFKGAVWDEDIEDEEVRLDDGTSDIDTLDAFEYSFEKFIPRMIKEF